MNLLFANILLICSLSIPAFYFFLPYKLLAHNDTFFIPKSHIQEERRITNSSVLVVYASCGKRYHFSIEKSIYPTYKLECNPETNYRDAREGGLFLDFIIQTYDNPLAEKYIFAQGHDNASHYRVDFWERIKYLSTTKYFQNSKCGAIYCDYHHFGVEEEALPLLNLGFMTNEYLLSNHITNVNIFIHDKRKDDIPCCSTFFVTPELIRRTPLEEYKRIRKALIEYVIKNGDKNMPNQGENYNAGIYLEYAWFLFFKLKSIPRPPCENRSVSN